MVVNEKNVWISSAEGLLKYDRKRLYWLMFTSEDGLLDNNCYQLLIDGDYLWIATASGISQFYWNSSDRID
jgi:ligand-binding sensor domain-containing protein